MIDVHKLVRYAFGNAISGQLSYGGVAVPVADDVLSIEDPTDIYVILSSQTAVEVSTFSSFEHSASIVIDIVHRSSHYVTKDIVDNVAQQIFTIIQPTPTTNGLSAQSGVQFTDVKKINDIYLNLNLSNSGPVVRRIVTYSVNVHQI